MKKNIVLFILFAGILGFAYLWEEKEYKNQFMTQVNQKLIDFDFSQVTEITLKGSKLYSFEDEWIIGEFNYPANKEIVDSMLKSLNGIVILKEIDKNLDEAEFFKYHDHSFSIKSSIDTKYFRLGDISEATGQFYIQEFSQGEKKLYLARDINTYNGLYKNEKEAEFQKYIKLTNIIRIKPINLITKSFFPNSLFQHIKKITIVPSLGESFAIDLKKHELNPSLPSGIKALPFFDVLSSSNKMDKILKLEDSKSQGLASQVSSIEIEVEQKKIRLKLFSLFKGERGYFVSNSLFNSIIQLNSVKGTWFNLKKESFWNKKFTLLTKLQEINSADFVIESDKKSLLFSVPDLKKFMYESKENLNTDVLNSIFHILLNSKGFEQADFIEVNKRNFEGNFSLTHNDQKYSFRIKNGVFNILEHSSNVIFTFIRPDHPFKSLNFSDFFTIKRKKL